MGDEGGSGSGQQLEALLTARDYFTWPLTEGAPATLVAVDARLRSATLEADPRLWGWWAVPGD